LWLKLPYNVPVNSTLNERFGIQQNVFPDASELPSLGYFVIGNGGHKWSTGANGMGIPVPVQHRGTDASCFSPIPFVLREQANDLTVTERARFALRRTETHGGKAYFAYYARRMDKSAVAAAMELVHVADGVSTVSAFTPDSSNLNPTPPTVVPDSVNVTTGDFTAITAKIGLDLSDWDIAELRNVAKVIYDDEKYAIVSEVGLVTGVDKVVSSPGPGNTTITQNEVIVAQVASFVNAFWSLYFNNKANQLLLDVGATEPLFNLE
jgi:hypothetical protein